jgi:hypothetical protein
MAPELYALKRDSILTAPRMPSMPSRPLAERPEEE